MTDLTPHLRPSEHCCRLQLLQFVTVGSRQATDVSRIWNLWLDGFFSADFSRSDLSSPFQWPDKVSERFRASNHRKAQWFRWKSQARKHEKMLKSMKFRTFHTPPIHAPPFAGWGQKVSVPILQGAKFVARKSPQKNAPGKAPAKLS